MYTLYSGPTDLRLGFRKASPQALQQLRVRKDEVLLHLRPIREIGE